MISCYFDCSITLLLEFYGSINVYTKSACRYISELQLPYVLIVSVMTFRTLLYIYASSFANPFPIPSGQFFYINIYSMVIVCLCIDYLIKNGESKKRFYD